MNYTKPVDHAAYEAERAEIKARYTPLLFNERIAMKGA